MRIDGHFIVSMIKSLFRIAGAIFLIRGNFVVSGILFLGAELLGVLEELV